jgi:hypothetical protein
MQYNVSVLKLVRNVSNICKNTYMVVRETSSGAKIAFAKHVLTAQTLKLCHEKSSN